METREKIKAIEELLELEEGTLEEDTVLDNLEEWDSVSILSLIVLLDEEYNKTITSKDIKEIKTVSDILKLME